MAISDRSTARAQSALYVWQSDYPWDVRAEKVCRALTDEGWAVHLAARNRRWEPSTERLPEALTHRLPEWRWAGRRLDRVLQFPAFVNPRWISLLWRVARRERPDVIVVRDVPLAPTALWVGRRVGLPVVLDMAENYPAQTRDAWAAGGGRPWDVLVRNPRAVAAVEAYCVRRVDHVVVVVEESADRVAALGVPQERITVVSNTPPRERALRPRGRAAERPGGRLELVYLGNLEIPRGLVELIDAVKILRDRSVPVRLTVVGAGRDASLFHARARQAGLTEEDLVFTGYIQSHEEALRVVASADVGVVPSHATEQWQASIPNKLFDYMAAGLPVVTSDTRPCARIVRATGAGDVFAAGDAAALAAAIHRLTDPTVRLAAGEAGRRAVLARYNWETDASVLCHVLERVVARHARRVTKPSLGPDRTADAV
jgi:glycosyltransferase involved in cell wall biosynthesis